MAFPPRTADTMSDAIAIASPNGRVSKSAHAEASRRLGVALFGENSTREDFTGRDTRDQRIIRAERIAYRMRDLRQFCARKLASTRPNAVNREMAALAAELEQIERELEEEEVL